LEGKRSRSFWKEEKILRFFLEGEKVPVFFVRAGNLQSNLKTASSFFAARRWNEHKRGQKVCIVKQTWNAASWWKECSIHTQTRICIQPGRGKQSWQGREIPKPSWGETEKALTAPFAGIQQKKERKRERIKENSLATYENGGECEEKTRIFTVNHSFTT
jgi:hypothetical protein